MHILTFDLEDWFHILDHESTKSEIKWLEFEQRFEKGLDVILELLASLNQKATFFCVGWVARKYPHCIKQIAKSGFELASHSDMHQLIYGQNRGEFLDDVRRSILTIEDITGEKVRAYRAPGFSLTKQSLWMLEALVDLGVEIDCSVFSSRRAHGGLPGAEIWGPTKIKVANGLLREFPVSALRYANVNMFFSGGGYFRLLPYFLINFAMRRSDYVMTYFHPRDFDSGQPLLNDLGLLRKIRTYFGVRSAFPKLRRLLRDFNFIDLRTADELIDWSRQKTVSFGGKAGV